MSNQFKLNKSILSLLTGSLLVAVMLLVSGPVFAANSKADCDKASQASKGFNNCGTSDCEGGNSKGGYSGKSNQEGLSVPDKDKEGYNQTGVQGVNGKYGAGYSRKGLNSRSGTNQNGVHMFYNGEKR